MRWLRDQNWDDLSCYAACRSGSGGIGCSARPLFDAVKKADVDSGKRSGGSTDVAGMLKALERENRERRLANDMLRRGSADFVQAELDGTSKQ